MKQTINWWSGGLRFFKKQWFVFLALAVYILGTASVMGPGFTDCTNAIYGFGDSTAGPIWRNSLEPDQSLLGSYQKSTNFPYGESLFSPVAYVSLVQTTSMKAATEVVGPVCAYNLYNIGGYLSTSLLMFFFVAYLIRNKWIALLVGYAVAFTPYVQSKVGGHPSYGYASLLIAALWLTFQVIATGKKRFAAVLGFVLAICAYFDPYFVLLVMTIVIPIFLVAGFARIRQLRLLKPKQMHSEKYRYIHAALVLMVCFSTVIAPLAIVRVRDATVIESSVGNVRGNVLEAAKLCSNKPLDYLLPDPTNIHLVSLFGQKYTTKNIELRNWCGFGESRVSISLTALTTLFIAASFLIWTRFKRKTDQPEQKDVNRYGTRTVVIAIIGIAALALLLGLPPYLRGIIMPSGMVLEITSMWRIFAREYIVLNIAVCALMAIALKYLSTNVRLPKPKITKPAILALIAFAILLEYQINAPFQPMTFNYQRDVPTVYETVRKDEQIKAIAEYPIDRMGLEYDSSVYYVTMQAVHKKSILNSIAIKDNYETLHVALKDLSDPQTIPALRYLGVTHVIIHGEKPEDVKVKMPSLQIISSDKPIVYGLTMVRSDDNNNVILAKLPDVRPSPNIITIEKGYAVNLPLIHSPIGIEYEVLQDTELLAKDLTEKSEGEAKVCFDVKMSAPDDRTELEVRSGKTVVERAMLNGYYQRIVTTVGEGERVTLHNSEGFNMRLNNLGCSENE